MQQSIYIPKHERNFIKVCEAYADRMGFTSWSGFLVHCVKYFINNLPRDQKKEFQDIAYEIAKKDRPEATDFVGRTMRRLKNG